MLRVGTGGLLKALKARARFSVRARGCPPMLRSVWAAPWGSHSSSCCRSDGPHEPRRCGPGGDTAEQSSGTHRWTQQELRQSPQRASITLTWLSAGVGAAGEVQAPN